MKQLIQKYQVGGFVYNPEVSKKTRKLVFDKNGIRYDIWQASRELENSGSVLGYNDLYNSIPRQEYLNRFQPVIDFFKSLPEIKTVHSSTGFGMKNNPSNSNSKIKQSLSVNQIKKQNTESNNKQKLNPNFHKKGGIIKAAQGWRVNNNRIIVTHGGTDFFVDPEAFGVDNEGFSNAAYIDSKGNKRYFRLTTHDINRLKQLEINYRSGKKIIESTYNPNKIAESPSQADPSAAQETPPASPDYSGVMDFIYQQVPWLKGFTPREGGIYTFNNGQWSEVQNKSVETPTETETPAKTVGQQPEAPTYKSLREVNTASINGNINSGSFRREYRKAFNEALLNGTIYGANNPNGTLVFDSNAVIGYDESGNPIYATADNIMQKYGLDGKISRRDMRMLRKDIIKNQNQVRMNNVSNFLGITSPAVVSPTTEEVVSTQSGVYQGATPEETANQKQNYDWSKTI